MRISDWSSDVCSSDLAIGIEVGAANIAHEQRISGEHTDGAVGVGRIMKHEGEVIIRVPGRFQHPDHELADLEFVSFAGCLGIGDRAFHARAVSYARTGKLLQERCPCYPDLLDARPNTMHSPPHFPPFKLNPPL